MAADLCQIRVDFNNTIYASDDGNGVMLIKRHLIPAPIVIMSDAWTAERIGGDNGVEWIFKGPQAEKMKLIHNLEGMTYATV